MEKMNMKLEAKARLQSMQTAGVNEINRQIKESVEAFLLQHGVPAAMAKSVSNLRDKQGSFKDGYFSTRISENQYKTIATAFTHKLGKPKHTDLHGKPISDGGDGSECFFWKAGDMGDVELTKLVESRWTSFFLRFINKK